MASALTSSPTQLHRDMRSEAKPFKRDRELSSKWAHGIRGNNSLNAMTYGTQFPEGAPANYKVRPLKKYSDVVKLSKSHANVVRGNTHALGKAGNRAARKNSNEYDSANTSAISKSLIDLLPAATPLYPGTSHPRKASSGYEGVVYSFDKSSPGVALGLDSLVDAAEKEWLGKETEKIVKKEWEVLDSEGEATKLKSKSKKSPTQKAAVVVDEDDWECI